MATQANEARRIKLGSQGLEVSAQGLGCMGLSIFDGTTKVESDLVAHIHHAISSGITLLDTSNIYGPETNELLLGKALKDGTREKVELATKFGMLYENGNFVYRGDPAYVRAACEASLRRLGVSYVNVYSELFPYASKCLLWDEANNIPSPDLARLLFPSPTEDIP